MSYSKLAAEVGEKGNFRAPVKGATVEHKIAGADSPVPETNRLPLFPTAS
jgi:hypothetical protein